MAHPKEDLIDMVHDYNAFMEEAGETKSARVVYDGLLVELLEVRPLSGSGDSGTVRYATPEEFAEIVGNL